MKNLVRAFQTVCEIIRIASEFQKVHCNVYTLVSVFIMNLRCFSGSCFQELFEMDGRLASLNNVHI